MRILLEEGFDSITNANGELIRQCLKPIDGY
jgi:hypothetical protein